MDELQQQLQQEQKIEQEIAQLKEQKSQVKASDEQEKQRIISALEKEIQRKKAELYEIREEIRRLKEENQNLMSKLQSENLDVALERLQKKYDVKEEDLLKIKDEILERYPDVVSADKLEELATGIYYMMYPSKIKELEEKLQISKTASEEIKKQNIMAASQYAPTTEEELTPEEQLIVQKYGVSPETIKKLKSQPPSYLTEGAEKPLI